MAWSSTEPSDTDRVSSRSDVVFTTVADGEANLTLSCCRLSVLLGLAARLDCRGDNRVAGDDFIVSGMGGAPSSKWRPASGNLAPSSNELCDI